MKKAWDSASSTDEKWNVSMHDNASRILDETCRRQLKLKDKELLLLLLFEKRRISYSKCIA